MSNNFSHYPYLENPQFLKKFDETKLKEQLVKIIVLTFNETPIQEIQGRVLTGNINIDSSSSMRRTVSISLLASDTDNNLTDIKNLLSINKKVEILTGFINMTDEYSQYPILWFPQGIYVITNPNINHTIDGIVISLTLHDKMALLNGECGGTFPASIVFNEIEDVDENGNTVISQPTIYQIIQELVNHWGGQQLDKIIISDIDNRIKKVMRWTGSTNLYYYKQRNSNTNTIAHYFTINESQIPDSISDEDKIIYEYGDDVGFILTDFVFPGELIGNAGDTVVTILDKIRDTLGNYEYFYDINGNFIFREIKNYLNTSFSTKKINQLQLQNNDYLVDYNDGKSAYTFDNANIIQSFSNSPQYQQIKNDFLVWGKRNSIDGKEIPIRYHLAIDEKPLTGNTYKVFFLEDQNDQFIKAKVPFQIPLNEKEEFDVNKATVNQYYYFNKNNKIYKCILENNKKEFKETEYQLQDITTEDWRNELYLDGVSKENLGLESNYYYAQLKNQWPKLYNIQETKDENNETNFKNEVLKHPQDIDFFLDFIDSYSEMGQFSINNIGRRTTSIVDDTINCIFETQFPDLVIIEKGTDNTDDIRNECETRRQNYVQVQPQIYTMLLNGGVLKSAYQEIRKELYQYTNYNEQVSITTLPIYYLDPNSRITIRDKESNIYGDYIIKSISLPLNINGTMNISCIKALERI